MVLEAVRWEIGWFILLEPVVTQGQYRSGRWIPYIQIGIYQRGPYQERNEKQNKALAKGVMSYMIGMAQETDRFQMVDKNDKAVFFSFQEIKLHHPRDRPVKANADRFLCQHLSHGRDPLFNMSMEPSTCMACST